MQVCVKYALDNVKFEENVILVPIPGFDFGFSVNSCQNPSFVDNSQNQLIFYP
jgi:hypothetical protein